MSKADLSGSKRSRSGRVRRRIQRVAFNTLYRFGGSIYDPFTRFLFGGSWDRWRESAISFIECGPVLDVGCGTGVLVAQLVEAGFDAFGIDREPSMLERARRRSGGRVARAAALELPFANASFNAVTATFPARFVLEPATLSEISRVLSPGGVFVVVLTGESRESTWWRWPLRVMLRLFYGARSETSAALPEPLPADQMKGEWRWIEQGKDRALVWIAVRTSS